MVVHRPEEVKESSKSTANESRGGKTSRSSNSVPQKHKQMPASKHSADSGTGAGGIHEEWETASESSDVLKDSESQQQSQSTRGNKQVGSRRDSRRGYSNQRHTHSRRGRYRDHPLTDVSIGGQYEPGSGSSAGINAGLTATNSAAVASAGSGGMHNTFPPGDQNVPSGNVHAVYRVDQVVFNDPVAIQTAFSDVFVRCVYFCKCRYVTCILCVVIVKYNK